MTRSNKLAVLAALTFSAFTAPVAAQEIAVDSAACADIQVREQRCISFDVNASLQQISDLYSTLIPMMSPERLKRLNNWTDADSQTIIQSGTWILYT